MKQEDTCMTDDEENTAVLSSYEKYTGLLLQRTDTDLPHLRRPCEIHENPEVEQRIYRSNGQIQP